MKVILNKCFGGFEVSNAAYILYAKKKGMNLFCYSRDDRDRRFYKTDKAGNGWVSFFSKDMGDAVHEKDVDWDSYVRLGSELREDSVLVEVVEELGSEAASGPFGHLVVVDIPDGLDYVVEDYDGIETLHERVRVW